MSLSFKVAKLLEDPKALSEFCREYANEDLKDENSSLRTALGAAVEALELAGRCYHETQHFDLATRRETHRWDADCPERVCVEVRAAYKLGAALAAARAVSVSGGERWVIVDKDGWPVERIKGRRFKNFIRLLLYGRGVRRWPR